MAIGKMEKAKKIKKLIEKYVNQRKELKSKIKNINIAPKERVQFMLKLDSLTKNSSKVRDRHRCPFSCVARGTFRFFGVSRHILRARAAMGLLPGIRKASW